MTPFERVKERAKSFGMNVKETALKSGIGENSIYRWREQAPTSDKLAAVAKVLHTSTDYLLGNTDDPSPAKEVLKPDEQNLLLNYQKLSEGMSDEEKENFSKSVAKMAAVMKDYLQKEQGTEKGEKIL